MAFTIGVFAAPPLAPRGVWSDLQYGKAQNVRVAGTHAFLSAGTSGVLIIDISNLDSPALVGSFDTPGTASSVWQQGNLIYVADGAAGLQIVDVTDPAHPQLKGSLDTPGNAQDILVSGNYAYEADLDSGVGVINISNPSAPLEVHRVPAPKARGLSKSGNVLYVWGQSLDALNLINPVEPATLGRIASAQYAAVSGSIAVVGGFDVEAFLYDVSDPTNASMLGQYGEGYEGAFTLQVVSNRLFVAMEKRNGPGNSDFSLRSVDIHDPAHPVLEGELPLFPLAMDSSTNFLYVVDDTGVFRIFEIASSQTGDVPNLQVSGPVVVASQTGRTNDSNSLLAGDALYLSWGVTNAGSGRVSAGSNIVTSVFTDNALRLKITNAPPINPGTTDTVRDVSIGSLPAGTHQVRIEIDSNNSIPELSESDNTYERSISLAAPPVSGATATAQVVNGFVVGLTLTQKGYGYTSPPQVIISGGGGSGATATAQVENGVVTGLTITNPGSGYATAPQVTIDFPQVNFGARAGIGLGLSDDLDFPRPYTIEFWINPREAGPVLSVNMSSENYYWNVHLADLRENGDLEISYDWDYYEYVLNNGVEELKTNAFRGERKIIGNIPFNQWTHVAVRYDSDADFSTGFINGVPSANTLSGHRVTFINPFVFNVGAGLVSGATPYAMDADLDEVRRWTVSRPDALVTSLFNKSIVTTVPTLAVNWTFEESVPQGAVLVEAQIPGLTRTNLVELPNLGVAKAVVRENTGVTPGRAGKNLFLDYVVRNNAGGAFAAGTKSVAEIYFDNVLQARTTNNAPTSAGASVNINGLALGTRTEGQHSLRIVLDPANLLAEADETDNVFQQTITVLPDAPPNLVFGQPAGWTNSTVIAGQPGQTSDQPLSPGDPIYVSWGMLNAGPGRAGPGVPGSYYKLVTSVYVDDVLKATSTNTGPDLPGDPAIIVPDINIGALSAGTHQLKLVLDSSNVIAETNESDNTLQRSFQVAAPPLEVAVAQAQVVNGFVVGLILLDRGYGYFTPPAVAISGGGGSGATATAQIANGRVIGFTITNPGSGYATVPQVAIAPPAGFEIHLSLHQVAFPLPAPQLKLPLSRPPAYGEVIAWGYNGGGQTNLPPGLTNVIAVSAGYNFSLALRSDLTVTAWGTNDHNQLSLPPDLTSVVRIVAGHSHALALKSDGTIRAWGWNDDGQATVPPGLSNIVDIGAGERHSAVLRGDGTVLVWGNNSFRQTNSPAGLNNVVAISVGGFHTLALKNDGTVIAWGDSDHGITNVPPSLNNVVAIEAGDYHSLALKNDGAVVAWGLNDRGQTNIPPDLKDVVAIGAGGNHSFAIKIDGTAVFWGGNTYGQGASIPGLDHIAVINGNFYHNLALRTPSSQPAAIGRAALTLNLVPGSQYQIETSGDLSTWNPFADSFSAEAPSVDRELFIDPTNQYFRVRQIPP